MGDLGLGKFWKFPQLTAELHLVVPHSRHWILYICLISGPQVTYERPRLFLCIGIVKEVTQVPDLSFDLDRIIRCKCMYSSKLRVS